MRTVDRVKHEGKRCEILDAAVRCFVRHGFHGTSIAHICAEAGMSAGHLYHYFPGKDAIVEAMVAANLERAERSFAEAARQGSSVRDVIMAQLDQGDLDHVRRAPLLFDLLADAGRNPAMANLLARHSLGMEAILIELLRHGQARGEIDTALDPEVVAPVLIALIDGSKSLGLRTPHLASARSGEVLRLLISRFLSPPST